MKNILFHIMQFVQLIPFLMVLSTVFAVSPELGNGVVSGKYFRFYLSMGMVAVTSVWMVFQSPASVRFNRPDGLILLFGVVTLPVSCWLNHSEAITKHILLLLIILLYFYFKLLFRSNRQAGYWMVLFFLVTGLVESYWGLRQLYGLDYSQHGRFRLTGSFFNPGPYACYISVVLPAAFYYMLRHWDCAKVKFNLRYWPVYLRWGIALLTVVGALLVLPAAMSRASWLAAAGGCGLVAFFYLKCRGYALFAKRNRWILGSVVLALAILGGVGMYRMKKDSADGRALIWKISLQTAVHHPLGVGIGNFSGSYGHEQAAYFASGRGTEQERHVAGNPEYGFNEYLQIGIEQGIVPFVLFLSIMGYGLYIGVRRRRIAATASLLALLIAAGMSYPFSVLPFLIVMVFLLAEINGHSGIQEFNPRISRITRMAKDSGIQSPNYTDEPNGLYSYNLSNSVTTDSGGQSPNNLFSCNLCNSWIRKRRMLVWVGVLLTAGCLYNRYPTYQAYKDWGRASFLYHSGAYESAGEAYAPLYPQLDDQLKFLFEYAQCLSKTGRHKESNEVLEKAVRISCDPMPYNIMGKNYQAMQCYADAERCFRKAAHIVPNRIYPWFLLANLYKEMGLQEKARETAEIVLTKEPKVQSTAVREMREKMKKIINE
jgi:tetratricopeptide (TPR) repeat protein